MTPTDHTDPIVARARAMAVAMHDGCGHTRSDGAPYWTHPERVVATLARFGQPGAVLAAAWLHDVPEDCPSTLAECRAMLERIGREFGPEVAGLVGEVTNFSTPDETLEVKQARLREHARSMSHGAKWIKLADRWDNISGMDGWSADKKRRYAQATVLLLEALAPLPPGSEPLARQIADKAAAVLG